MIKHFMITTTIILTLFVLGGLSLSPLYTVRAFVSINAPIEKVHALVSNLNEWDKWSPWLKHGEGVNIVKPTGIGATQTWTTPTSKGHLTFTKVDEKSGLNYDIFFRDGAVKNEGAFIYKQEGNATVLTWTMSGEIQTPVVAGYVAFVTERLSGATLDEGLINIKRLAEKK
jgi:hypothetical protein